MFALKDAINFIGECLPDNGHLVKIKKDNLEFFKSRENTPRLRTRNMHAAHRKQFDSDFSLIKSIIAVFGEIRVFLKHIV